MLPTLYYLQARGDGYCLLNALDLLLPQKVSRQRADYEAAIDKFRQMREMDAKTAGEIFRADLEYIDRLHTDNPSELPENMLSLNLLHILAIMNNVNILCIGWTKSAYDDMWSYIGTALQEGADNLPDDPTLLSKWLMSDYQIDCPLSSEKILDKNALISSLLRQNTPQNPRRRMDVFCRSYSASSATESIILLYREAHFDALSIPEGCDVDKIIAQISGVIQVMCALRESAL